MDAWYSRDVRLGTDGFDHLARWTTAAISPTERHQQFSVDILLPVMFPGCFHIVGIGKPIVVVVILDGFTGSSKKSDQHFRPVHPAPMKCIIRKAIKFTPVYGGTGKIIHSTFLHELRNHPRKPKCIRHPQHLAVQTKLAADKPLAE